VIRWIMSGAVAASLLIAGCGSSSGPSSSSQSRPPKTTTTDPSVTAKPAGATPSDSAVMVCAAEAQRDMAATLGVGPTEVTAPTWTDHVYSCTYKYPNGYFVMSVKELDSLNQTVAYYDALRARLGERPGPIALGNGAFVATDGSVVVRKDFKVLLVDITHLPVQFGTPPQDRSDAALSIAATVMSCWTGA
jgi:hypothetical protein